MSSLLTKIGIKTATQKKNKLDLSCTHITTSDFFKLSPTYIKEMVPGESVNIKMATFARLAPLVNPMLGQATITNRAFFVPMRTIFPSWNEFITDTINPSNNTVRLNVPTVRPAQILAALIKGHENYLPTKFVVPQEQVGVDEPYIMSLLNVIEGSSNCDLYLPVAFLVDEAGSNDVEAEQYNKFIGLNFTAEGRKAVQILESLGYKFGFSNAPYRATGDYGEEVTCPIELSLVVKEDSLYSTVNDTITSPAEWSLNASLTTPATLEGNNKHNKVVSALPLIAFCKIFHDWYRNMQYSERNNVVERTINKLDLDVTSKLESADIIQLLLAITDANYSKDYFTAAFDRPNMPTIGSSTTIYDINDASSSADMISADPAIGLYPQLYKGGLNLTRITQFGLDALKGLTDYMKRHLLAGTLAMDRFMARFGVKPSDAALKRSVYLGKMSTPLLISDVMSTGAGVADNAVSRLGDYAGKGIAYTDGGFNYETNEYGYIIVVSVIQPKVGYVQGRPRMLNHISKEQFFTPEYDALGVAAIRRDELVAGCSDPDGVFGYTSRYAEYKSAQDNLTGDFKMNSKKLGLDSWHLFRDVTDEQAIFGHNEAFCIGDAQLYDRIFAYNRVDEPADSVDHFYLIHNFNVTSYAPMSKLFDDYEFEEDEHGNGKNVDIEIGGTQLN